MDDRESSVTLGLGVNRLLVFVVDSTSGDIDERRVLNVYTLTVFRQTRYMSPSTSFSRRDAAAAPSEACTLLQVTRRYDTIRYGTVEINVSSKADGNDGMASLI